MIKPRNHESFSNLRSDIDQADASRIVIDVFKQLQHHPEAGTIDEYRLMKVNRVRPGHRVVVDVTAPKLAVTMKGKSLWKRDYNLLESQRGLVLKRLARSKLVCRHFPLTSLCKRGRIKKARYHLPKLFLGLACVEPWPDSQRECLLQGQSDPPRHR